MSGFRLRLVLVCASFTLDYYLLAYLESQLPWREAGLRRTALFP